MKKMFVVLGLVVMMMFVVSCAPGKAIAGQAVSKGNADTDVDVSNNVRYGDIVNIKSSSNKYWTADFQNVGSGSIKISTRVIKADRANAGEWERFQIMPTTTSQKVGSYVTTGSKIALLSLRNPSTYVTAEKGEAYFPWALYNQLKNNQPQTIGEWEIFKVQNPSIKSGILTYGTSFTLLNAHNKYVSASPEGGVAGNRDKVGEWELFTFEKAK